MIALPRFQSRVVPVIALHDATQAVRLAHALLDGGIDVMEITLRTPQALQAIEAVARDVPQMVVAAGTVTRAAEVASVCAAGARLALSPGLTQTLAQAACDAGLPFIPGVMTPGEVLAAREQGFGLLKLFPAAQAGGLAMLQALAGPFPEIRFCPTGGIHPDNLGSYLAQRNVAFVGGSWLTPPDMLERRDWAGITALARAASALWRPATDSPAT